MRREDRQLGDQLWLARQRGQVPAHAAVSAMIQASFASVRVVPGPCSRWNDEDADFIREILDLVGDKWSVLIIGTLAEGSIRYSDLGYAIPGVSQRMLTLKLKQRQRDGLITRTAYPEVPPRVEYALTQLGTSLLSTVLALAAWSADHHAEIRRHQQDFDAETPAAKS